MKYLNLLCLIGLLGFTQLLNAQSAEKTYEITITTIDIDGTKEVKELVIEGEDLSQEEIDALIKKELDGTEKEVDVNVNVSVAGASQGDDGAKTITKIIKQRSNLGDEEKIIIDETDMEIEVVNDKVYINGEEVKEGKFGDKQVRILKFEEGDDYELEDLLEGEGIEINKDEKVYFIEKEELQEGVAFLGVTVGSSKDGGIGIKGAVAGTSAEKMGLKEGDVLMSIDGHKVIGFSSLSKTVKSYLPGETVTVVYSRDGVSKEVEIEMSDYEKYNNNYTQRRPSHKGRSHRKSHSRSDKKMDKVMLGVRVKAIGDQLEIVHVREGSAAEKAGLQVGDVILKLNKAKMLSADQFHATIKAHKEGDEVKLKVNRSGKKKNVIAKLEKMSQGERRHKHNKKMRTERIIIKERKNDTRANNETKGAIKINKFDLSPNPSAGIIKVDFTMDELESGEQISMRIISLDGKVLKEEILKESDGQVVRDYNLTEFGSGIFLLQIEKDKQTFTKRFVIEKD